MTRKQKKRKRIHNQSSSTLVTETLKMGQTELEEVKVYKYLGLKIDNELKFKIHVKGIIKHVAHKAYLLAKLRKSLTLKAAKDVLKRPFYPCLMYVMSSMTVSPTFT